MLKTQLLFIVLTELYLITCIFPSCDGNRDKYSPVHTQPSAHGSLSFWYS